MTRLETPHGPARVRLHAASRPIGGLLLGHGAGGSTEAPDLVAATAAALSADVSVALVEQPYRVAGRRAPAPAGQLDAAWTAVAQQLGTGPLAGLPLIAGGRSSGARVACRTASAVGAVGVVCLAFPTRSVPRGARPRQDRTPELDAVTVPVLVVQGTRDPFGMPADGPRRTVVAVPGNHSLRGDLGAASAAICLWLRSLLRIA